MLNYLPYQQNGLVQVTGLEGAKAYRMPPNSAVALFHSTEDVFYVKSTDGAGFPTIRAFKFEEITLSNGQPSFVTKDELNELKEMIKDVKFSISKQQSSECNSTDKADDERKSTDDVCTDDEQQS